MPAHWTKELLPHIAVKTSLDQRELLTPQYIRDSSGPRVLVIVDHILHSDRISGELLSGNNGVVFENILEYLTVKRKVAWSECRVVAFPLGAAPQSPKERSEAKKLSKKRIDAIIAQYQPNRILVMGQELAKQLLPSNIPEVEPIQQFGVVRDYQGIQATCTLSLTAIANSSAKDDKLRAWPNLIGFVVNHFNYLLLKPEKRFTIDISKYRYKIIKTYAQFKEFYRELEAAPIVSIDVETTNLSKFVNELLSVQFAFDGQTAYVLPYEHPESPFDAKTREKIKRKLKKYFEFGTSKYHIFAFGQFDIAQLTVQFGLRYYNHEIFDILGASYCLDENRKFLNDVIRLDGAQRFSGFSLGQLSLERGCSIYFTDDLEVSKGQRTQLNQVPLKDLAEYGGYDVIIPYQLHESYLAEARYRGKQYHKFRKTVTKQIGAMIHEFAIMEINGLYCDINYLLEQFEENSQIENYIKRVERKLYKRKSVRKANKLLLEQKHLPQSGLFEDNESLFNINEIESQQALFFGILGLKPLEQRKDAKGGKLDKEFQAAYSHVREVRYYTQLNKAKSIKNTFLKGFYRILQSNPDSRVDKALHPTFTYLTVITGRSGAKKPSLQQIPSRGELSGIIKRIFVPPPGEILIKADYVAHEIRNWAYISHDEALAAAFQVGIDARQAYRLLKRIDAGIKAEWEAKFKASDLHRVNYGFFYDVDPAGVTKEQRQSIKNVVFGVLYGKQAPNLAKVLETTPEQAQELIDLLFTRFESGGRWVRDTIAYSRKNAHIVGPQGRVRHLWGYLHWDRSIQSRMDRRSPNSEIQGFSSDEGYMGGRLLQKYIWEYFVQHGQPFSMRSRNKVHDSNENTAAIIEVPIALYLLEHAYTVGTVREYRKSFGFEMGFPLELDIGLGGSLNNISDWDGTRQSLLDIVDSSIDWMRDNLGYELDKAQIMKTTSHNAKIIDRLRRRELKENLDQPLLTPKNARRSDLIFAVKAQ